MHVFCLLRNLHLISKKEKTGIWPDQTQGLNSTQKLPGKIDFFPHCAAVINSNSDTLTDWGKLLILHALDAMYTPPSFCHTGKFSVPRRLRQKMRLLYLNDYGNAEHAAGPLQDKGFLLCSLLAVLQSAIVLFCLTMGMSFKRHFSFFPPPPVSFQAPLFTPSAPCSSPHEGLRVCQSSRCTGPDIKWIFCIQRRAGVIGHGQSA